MSLDFPRILVADDEPAMRCLLRLTLKAHGYSINEAASAQEALQLVPALHPDLLILDLDLPDLDAIDVVRLLREWSRLPILALTAREGEADIVAALDAGADDCLRKPFRTAELLARIRALLRRSAAPNGQSRFTVGALTVDLARRDVRLGDAYVPLTPTEYEVLRVLVGNADRVVTYRQLVREIWGGSFHEDAVHLLRVNVSTLRRKLEADPARPEYILTENRVGYRLRATELGRKVQAAG